MLGLVEKGFGRNKDVAYEAKLRLPLRSGLLYF